MHADELNPKVLGQWHILLNRCGKFSDGGSSQPQTEPVYGLMYSASPSRLDRSQNQAPAPRDPRTSSAAGHTMDIDGFVTTSGRRSAKDQDRVGHDLDQLTALQEFMGLPGDADPQGYTDVPGRRSEDLVCNFAGHQLGALCRSQGLLVLNGRVSGDLEGRLTFPKGEAGGSMIDLFVGSAGVLRHAYWMRVGELLAPDGWFPTDHRPVTLVLGLAVGGTGTSAKGCCQKKRAVFEISRYRDYAALFTDGSQVMHALNGVITDLSNGACNSTESVEHISTLLRKDGEKRVNRIVFIGLHQDREQLASSPGPVLLP
ncbi:hypothetical protein VOLCADRAFT_88692 [Volvox carteri f. nagariensis]|uniref:Endonuclease/exonuclease/phosphatase domain-containing protein n=1 Tax=Volvox carteri f. nagariensis TaxID=3068 RepID=D8TPP7_VOLCA|nr:uncharacterized protein VOLCADRAFT_88692 [Volvox carteri f. nagariensis]EFJ50804.1 hypothetical protein VOLCADRAFT_88692 [Volvox carteri f. nagariensis]|eukprot:XP_002948397.1 hypothetical protein VOLCADRAFT_88692 [Volvox carteri f. nagariensis]